MSANFRDGKMVQLDRRAEPEEQVPEDDAKDPSRLARLLMRILRDVARLKRRWAPRFVDFEDVPLDASGTGGIFLPHGFRGRVRYWVTEWDGVASPNIRARTDSAAGVLVLTSTSDGIATVRVEEAG